MQMDAEFKKEQIGTLFCLGGGSGRGVWGVGVPSRVPTPKVYMPSKKKKNCLLTPYIYFILPFVYDHFGN
jgi:hypothetical protein